MSNNQGIERERERGSNEEGNRCNDITSIHVMRMNEKNKKEWNDVEMKIMRFGVCISGYQYTRYDSSTCVLSMDANFKWPFVLILFYFIFFTSFTLLNYVIVKLERKLSIFKIRIQFSNDINRKEISLPSKSHLWRFFFLLISLFDCIPTEILWNFR